MLWVVSGAFIFLYFSPGLPRRHEVLPLLLLLMITSGASPYVQTSKHFTNWDVGAFKVRHVFKEETLERH